MNPVPIFWALQAAVLVLALLGGGIFPSTVCLVAVFTVLAYSLVPALTRWRTASLSAPGPAAIPPVSTALEILMSAVLLFVLLTALPLPPMLDPLIGPLRASQNHAAATLLKEAARIGFFEDGSPWFCLSRNRAGTLRMFLLLGAVFGSALCASRLPLRWQKAHLLFLAWAGGIIAIGGYVGQWVIPQEDTLWWTIPVPPTSPGPVGCFINRNHFAGFLAILCPVALALTDHFFRLRQRWNALGMAVLLCVMTFAMASTLSRGALLAFVVGTGATGTWIIFRRSRIAGACCLVLACGILLALYRMTPALRERVDELRDPEKSGSVQTRLQVWRETLRTAVHYPILGSGANGLRMTYPMHRTTSGKWLVNAENEYAQLLAEGGIIGTGLAVALALAAFRRRQSAPITDDGYALRIAVVGSLLTAAVHNAVDFPARQPLYAVVLASMAGLLIKPPSAAESPLRRAARLLPAALTMLGCAGLALGPMATLQRLDSYTLLADSPPSELRRAIVWAPTSWNAWYMSGRTACDSGLESQRLDLCVFGESLMSRAAACDPNNYRLWYDTGLVRRALRQKERADEAFARARELRPWVSPPPEGRQH